MRESDLMRRIQVRASTFDGVRLFRNNVGACRTVDGRVIRFGVGGPGGSDLIGWKSITITPEMIGKKIAALVLCEVKLPNSDVTEEQQTFLQVGREAGAIAFVARTEDDAARHLSATGSGERR